MKWKAKLLIYRVLAYAMDSVWALIFSSFLKDLLTTPRIEPLRSWMGYELPFAYSVSINKWGFLFLRQLGAGVTGYFQISNIIGNFLYFTLCWSILGASFGQIMFGLIVVDSKRGDIPSFFQSFLRYIGYWLLVFSFYLGFFLSLFDRKGRGLHDMISGTQVSFAEELSLAERKTSGHPVVVNKPIWKEWMEAVVLWAAFFLIEISLFSPIQKWSAQFGEFGKTSQLLRLPLSFSTSALLIEIPSILATIIVIYKLVLLWKNQMLTKNNKIVLTIVLCLNVICWLGMLGALSNISDCLSLLAIN
jgi:uncharacterized RDD family membrane protein YckC